MSRVHPALGSTAAWHGQALTLRAVRPCVPRQALPRPGRPLAPRGAAWTSQWERHQPRVRLAAEGGVDFAVIRFRIPGFDDLTMLPRVVASVGVVLLALNRAFYSTSLSGEENRIFSEVLAWILVVCCAVLPFLGRRLEEAAKRQVVSGASSASQPGCVQTFSLDRSLPEQARLDLAWATTALLRLTNAEGLALWIGGPDARAIGTRGVLKQLPGFSGGNDAILEVLSSSWKPKELAHGFCATRASLEQVPGQVLPKAVLPGNTEAVLVKPLGRAGLLVLWSAQVRAFDQLADRAWVTQISTRLSDVLQSTVELPQCGDEVCFEKDVFSSSPGEVVENRDPFARFGEQIRLAPGAVGVSAMAALGENRNQLLTALGSSLVGIDPAQTRTDLVGVTMASTLLMQTLIWQSEVPDVPLRMDTTKWEGVTALREANGGCATLDEELLWTWDTVSSCTRASSLVIFWRNECVLQGGLFRTKETGGEKPVVGPLLEGVMKTRRGRFLAQLKSYPDQVQFTGFMPQETQGLVLTPLAAAPEAPVEGVMAIGLDATRGIGKVDQAWLGAIAEKLAVSLAAMRN